MLLFFSEILQRCCLQYALCCTVYIRFAVKGIHSVGQLLPNVGNCNVFDNNNDLIWFTLTVYVTHGGFKHSLHLCFANFYLLHLTIAEITFCFKYKYKVFTIVTYSTCICICS